jgi:hypothetical protein
MYLDRGARLLSVRRQLGFSLVELLDEPLHLHLQAILT